MQMLTVANDSLDANQLLKKLLGTFTDTERIAAKGKEVGLEKYLTENMIDYIDSQDLPV